MRSALAATFSLCLTTSACGAAPPRATATSASEDARVHIEASVRATVAASRDALRACYVEARATRPELTASVALRFRIVADGSVASAEVHASDAGDPALERCMCDALRAMTFAPLEAGGYVDVTFPFVLRTEPGVAPVPDPAAP